jgi:hypothetical protein
MDEVETIQPVEKVEKVAEKPIVQTDKRQSGSGSNQGHNQQPNEKSRDEKVRDVAFYYNRNPDELIDVLDTLKSIREKDPGYQALLKANKMELENAKKDCIIELGLTKKDMELINGSTSEEILENAKKLAEYKSTFVNVEAATETTKITDVPKFVGRYDNATKLQELENWFKQNKEVSIKPK